MSILIIVVCIALLVVLISYFKVNAFLSFLVVSILAGLLLGIEVSKISSSVQKGLGDMLGSLAIVVIAGAMLGKLVADSGAAQRISSGLTKLFGEKNLQWALMTTGFVIGIPLFYNVGFVLVFPLIASIVYRYKLPAVYIGLPMMAALSVTHGFLPPHPSPTALVAQFNAHMGTTLLYGFAIAIPTVLIAGLLYSKTLKGIKATLIKTFQTEGLPEDKLPSLANSLFSALLPVIFLTTTTLLNPYISDNSSFKPILIFLSDPAIVMLISLGVATFSLGILRGTQMNHIMNIFGDAVKDVSMILLIMGGAGGLKQVLLDSGISNEIAALLDGINVHPLVLGWIIACIIRVCVGSATVAGLTAAGIMLPFITRPDVDPNLMVLSIGAGSLMFSHVNDAGFWLFKEYFNLSIRDTIRSWSVMETIVAICGLAGVMIINAIIN
ncbi:MAG TPA: gluconate:H+ symporter [Cyclobacteriaceae bacterium]|jgi:Gnt-I system high-affinity gluconate transporter|nr:gluconate transporter [Cytophagales bacterium]HNT49637.1 gluconate:H+ symporter [Cyclobacteriaceae bacterium]HRE66250.1 gluconate:H+ symporter [Cyclobacteriaceae bacterium]HRF34023.1 gluconate:H+ symporter [Cyclobacteriaceae bacterium]